jgi:hypothetical protein
MCKQLKTGYTHCPHVHSDHEIISCNTAIEVEAGKIDTTGEDEVGNSFCERIEWEWTNERTMGRCYWCEKSEGDGGRAERRRVKRFGVGDPEGEGSLRCLSRS